jgi:hypothetical protein
MNKNYTLLLILIFVIFNGKVNAQTEWTGPTTTISKADFADWTLPANQDALTANVILTRADGQGIFNIAQEAVFDNGGFTSPIDTEWALGTIADGVGTLTYDTWDNTTDANPPSTIGVNMVVHLITDDIYIDIMFTSWTQGAGGGVPPGGGFSYDRSTDQSLSTSEFELDNKIKLFPNPSSDFIQISGLSRTENYRIYNIVGAEIKNGYISDNGILDIKNLTNGLFFLTFENRSTLKFIKK